MYGSGLAEGAQNDEDLMAETEEQPYSLLASYLERKKSIASLYISEDAYQRYEHFADLLETYSFPLFLSIFAVYSIM